VQGSSQSASALCESFGEPRFIRKKSGQLVKSSLKSSRSVSRTGLTVSTFSQSSKSEPTTPTSKAVHFDTQLEHVKLFLAEQKPLAVSRDGSPTDDTSGTDSDFPRFIFGDEDNNVKPKKKLVMQLANMPARVNPNSDVALEELVLASDGVSILGKVRVKNLAYAKWIAVRFTFDSWQTTSEVTGKYLESLSPEFDRFGFTIRLNDLLARIEGKTLIVAVRYSVEGKEIWDNNGGNNYVATFTKSKVVDESPSVQQRSFPLIKTKATTTLSDDEASTDLADLKNKLEKVVQSKDRTGPAFLASTPSTVSSSGRRLSPTPDTTSFRTSPSFGSRYDLAASLKNTWRPDVQSQPLHSRTHSFPMSSPRNTGSSIPFPQIQRHSPARQLGSPRDIGEDTFTNIPRQPSDYDNDSAPFHVQQPQPTKPARNHQRGYFDLAITTTSPPPSAMGLRRTPPGTPSGHSNGVLEDGWVASPQRYNSFPPLGVMASPVSAVSVTPTTVYGSTVPNTAFSYADIRGDGGDSELSTPSMVTPSSSRESTPSPSEMYGNGATGKGADMSPDTHYRHFLNKCVTRIFFAIDFTYFTFLRFCFFTGPGSSASHHTDSNTAGIEGIPRTHSASDVEEFLSGLKITPAFEVASANGIRSAPLESPARSPSLDDLMLNTSRSGSLTPTMSRMALATAKSYEQGIGTLHGQSGTPVLA